MQRLRICEIGAVVRAVQSLSRGFMGIKKRYKIIGGIAVVNCNSEMADELRGFLADLDYHLSRN